MLELGKPVQRKRRSERGASVAIGVCMSSWLAAAAAQLHSYVPMLSALHNA